jgi:photosystem II stability/assembly factor-like uncharacterized protein
MAATFVFAMAVDPQNAGTIYAGTGTGAFKSTDAGASWSALNVDLPSCAGTNIDQPTCSFSAIALDPRNPGVLYAGAQGGGTKGGGVFKSTDGGASWARFPVPKGGGVHGLTLDPQNPAILYAWNHSALMKSTDAAANWAEITGWRIGDPFVSIWCVDLPGSLAMDPRNTSTLYVATCPAGGGVFKSTDGGVSAHPLSFGPCCGSLAVDLSGTVYGISWFDGVRKSTDGGTNWVAANSGLPGMGAVHVLAIDPQNPGIVYAGSSGSGVFKSTDGGANWSAVNSGLTTLDVQTLAVDPHNTNTVYAGTNGGGVFAITFTQ